ncbi:hypothetical protein PFFVO_04002 [Plasmodium falciparum Vietnam Oak-Knoll (FVO)]|uniref:Uncharacterized protein n=1 Tax=Plasmodium falciparum Vietnam Oak-Knoll (FVO) TaxID=1036723 RepID=A0A024V4S0_PLAFA|nr:hypothetical protein PFFVO_04002 [Plasmodium falciparum Vietnam Oak-Knoll (FVO)]
MSNDLIKEHFCFHFHIKCFDYHKNIFPYKNENYEITNNIGHISYLLKRLILISLS